MPVSSSHACTIHCVFCFLLTESPYTASNQRGMYPSRQQAWHPLPEPGHSCKLKDA